LKKLLSVMVCDDHPLFRSGVISCLQQDQDLNIVAEASDGETCIAKLELLQPDILVMDLSMPLKDGFEVMRWINDQDFNIRVYILSMYAEVAFVQRAKELGASAFIAKEDAQTELLAAIDSNESTAFYLSDSIGRNDRLFSPQMSNQQLKEQLSKVSPAERKVLTLLTKSLTSRQIADQLNLSVRTIQAHRVSLADKLNAKGPNKLLELAIRNRDAIITGSNSTS